MVKEGKLWLNCLNATIGTFMFGYNLGVFNPCQKNVSKTLNWEDDESLLVLICTTLLPLGAWTGSLISARLAQRKGRRYSFMVACLIGIIGGALSSVPLTYTFASGRFISGVSVGAFVTVVPLYINEVVPQYLVSEIGVLTGLLIGFGLVVSFSLGLVIPDNTESSYNELWIFLFAFQSLVFFIQFLLFLFVFKFDTPQFYRTVRKYQEADAFLKYYEMELEFPKLHESEMELEEKGLTYKDLCMPENRKQFRIGVAFFSLQQLCGINFFIFYSVVVLQEVLDDEFLAKLITLSIGLSEFFSELAVLYLAKKFGRKILTLGGIFLMMVSLVLTGVLVFFEIEPAWIIIFPLFVFTCGFSMSPGVTIYIYAGETLEEKSMSIANGVNWFLTIVIAVGSPELILYLGFPITVGIFALLNLLFFVYMYFDMLETKGMTREEIKELFASRSKKV